MLRISNFGLVLLGMLVASCAATSFVWAGPVFCELAALPSLSLASDSTKHFTPEELLDRVALSYRGLLEFAGDEFSEGRLAELMVEPTLHQQSRQLEKFFAPVAVAEQRSVALNESLTRLGDWVLLDAEERGLSQEMILTRLREVVRVHLGQIQQVQERVGETGEDRRDPGVETSTGAVFYRDTRFPNLGEAYRDPSGMVWGDVVKDGNGEVLKTYQVDALKYCQEIGAELPSRKDFERLREYMGAQPGVHEGYRPQILPGRASGQFWSSSVYPDDSNFAYGFVGGSGHIGGVRRDLVISVRCVVR